MVDVSYMEADREDASVEEANFIARAPGIVYPPHPYDSASSYRIGLVKGRSDKTTWVIVEPPGPLNRDARQIRACTYGEVANLNRLQGLRRLTTDPHFPNPPPGCTVVMLVDPG